MGMDKGSLAVYAGVFPDEKAAIDYMQLTDGKPMRFMEDMYLTGDFCGRIEIRYFSKSTNNALELFTEFPYSENIIGMLRAMYKEKLPRRMNTAIVLYDFYLGAEHFTGHSAKQMSQKKGEDYSILHIANIVHYQAPEYLDEHPEFKYTSD